MNVNINLNFIMTHKYITRHLVSICFAVLGALQTVSAATDCSQQAIQFYLEKGFTHDQIVKMCNDPVTNQIPVEAPAIKEVPDKPDGRELTSVSSNFQEDTFYFNNNILADKVSFSAQQLSYTREECIVIGDSDMFIYNDKYCAEVHTDIALPGLKVLKAVKGSFFSETELLIQSTIQRTLLNENSLDAKTRRVFSKMMKLHPEDIDIPIRDDIDPEQVAHRLRRYQ